MPFVAEVVNRSIKADCTDFTIDVFAKRINPCMDIPFNNYKEKISVPRVQTAA